MTWSAYFCGSVTQTTRSTRRSSRSTSSRWPPGSSRSRAGRAGRGRAARLRRRAVERALPDEPAVRRDAEPVEQPGGALRRSTRRRGRRRWSGRRTPTVDSSIPVSALNRLDLPLPVAPASATTVWSRDSARRPPARSTIARAGRRRVGGYVVRRRSGEPVQRGDPVDAADRRPPAGHPRRREGVRPGSCRPPLRHVGGDCRAPVGDEPRSGSVGQRQRRGVAGARCAHRLRRDPEPFRQVRDRG